MKKIAILGIRGIPARYGGFETFAEELSRRLVEQGIKVTVFCEHKNGTKLPDEYQGVHLEYLCSPSIGPFTTILFDFLCLWRARKSFDVVYMLGYGSSLFCFIPRLYGSKVWINMDGLEWKRAKWSWPAQIWLRAMERVAMWTPSMIIADANAIKTSLENRHRYMADCVVISYGALVVAQAPSGDFLIEWGVESDAYYLVVCRLEPENHLREILLGFNASGSVLPLIIVGDHHTNTPYVSQLLAMQNKRIRFIGTIYDQAKLQALRYHCRAYFHGHSVGGTNPSLLEALGCGNNVIAHDNPFNREVAGEAAYYFESATDIPRLIERMEGDNSRREIMRSLAKKIVTRQYTWEMVTKRYLHLLHECSRFRK